MSVTLEQITGFLLTSISKSFNIFLHFENYLSTRTNTHQRRNLNAGVHELNLRRELTGVQIFERLDQVHNRTGDEEYREELKMKFKYMFCTCVRNRTYTVDCKVLNYLD